MWTDLEYFSCNWTSETSSSNSFAKRNNQITALKYSIFIFWIWNLFPSLGCEKYNDPQTKIFSFPERRIQAFLIYT